MGGWMRIEMNLIKHNYERPGLSQRELAAWAKVQFKLKKAPAQTTVSDILKLAATIMDEAYGDEGVNEESSGNRDESSVEDVINTSLVDCQITC
ncbi:hypothetical protein GQ600_3930 [Phytophthora cactorum]|nr:hypothetical protein GQ600_3930 [Phytophthora cactorum]